ncbi:MAG: hypothetical protein PHU23_12630 [Dehalococcoidales bacterium]|nr:hypothetical protein [Dehalococcoidales bacterium]
MLEAIKKFTPQSFNDLLCLFILAAIFAIWIMQSRQVIEVPEVVLGATIACFTMVTQYYFRKKPTEKG